MTDIANTKRKIKMKMNNNITYNGENTNLSIYKISRRLKSKNIRIVKIREVIEQVNNMRENIYNDNKKEIFIKAIKLK